MTLNLLLRQSSFLDLCPVTAAVEELANAGGIEERGAIFTRREVVDFILDLVGYTSDRPLQKLTLLEPSFGDGDFLFPAIDRLLTAWKATGKTTRPLEALGECIRAVELHRDTFNRTHAAVVNPSGARVSNRYEPSTYEAWYHTPRGAWIGDIEFAMMMKLLHPEVGGTLLDVGSGTGYFSRRFAAAGLRVIGLEPDTAMLHYVSATPEPVAYVAGNAEQLPFADRSFDYVAAVTSLCFVNDPVSALHAMWRVARRGLILGLLNRASLLHRRKHGQGAYAGARWDAISDVQRWVRVLSPVPVRLQWCTGIFFPDGAPSACLLERLLPAWLPWGGFLAVYLHKPVGTEASD